MQFDDMLSGSSEVTLITGDGSRWVGLQVQVLVPGVYIIRFAKNMINSPLPPPKKRKRGEKGRVKRGNGKGKEKQGEEGIVLVQAVLGC